MKKRNGSTHSIDDFKAGDPVRIIADGLVTTVISIDEEENAVLVIDVEGPELYAPENLEPIDGTEAAGIMNRESNEPKRNEMTSKLDRMFETEGRLLTIASKIERERGMLAFHAARLRTELDSVFEEDKLLAENEVALGLAHEETASLDAKLAIISREASARFIAELNEANAFLGGDTLNEATLREREAIESGPVTDRNKNGDLLFVCHRCKRLTTRGEGSCERCSREDREKSLGELKKTNPHRVVRTEKGKASHFLASSWSGKTLCGREVFRTEYLTDRDFDALLKSEGGLCQRCFDILSQGSWYIAHAKGIRASRSKGLLAVNSDGKSSPLFPEPEKDKDSLKPGDIVPIKNNKPSGEEIYEGDAKLIAKQEREFWLVEFVGHEDDGRISRFVDPGSVRR